MKFNIIWKITLHLERYQETFWDFTVEEPVYIAVSLWALFKAV